MKSRCIVHAGSLSMLDIVVDFESIRFCGVPLISQVMVTKSNIPRKQYGHTVEKNSLNPILLLFLKPGCLSLIWKAFQGIWWSWQGQQRAPQPLTCFLLGCLDPQPHSGRRLGSTFDCKRLSQLVPRFREVRIIQKPRLATHVFAKIVRILRSRWHCRFCLLIWDDRSPTVVETSSIHHRRHPRIWMCLESDWMFFFCKKG